MLEQISASSVGRPQGSGGGSAAALIDGLVIAIVDTILRLVLGNAGAAARPGRVGRPTSRTSTARPGRRRATPRSGIRVVDVRDRLGQPIGYGRAFLRWLVSIVSLIVILLGYLWMLWDPQEADVARQGGRLVPIHVCN